MQKSSLRGLTLAAVLAALYAALTILLPVPQYAGVQVRFAEALTVLPWLFPAATPGLIVGCALANLFSPFPLDVLFGSLATALACLWTRRIRRRALVALPAVVCNAVIIGAEAAFFEVGASRAFPAAFALNALTVALGEILSACILGALLLTAFLRSEALRSLIPPERLALLRSQKEDKP